MAAEARNLLTVEEYLRLEREGDIRHEYISGKVFEIGGASRRHNLINGNASASLHGQLRKRSCEVYSSSMRINVSVGGFYAYPDIVVVCGEPQFSDETVDTLLNPTVLIEIFSPSTEGHDRGKKFHQYQKLRSLKEYLLITQDASHVDHFVRQGENSWLLTPHNSLAATIHLHTIDCTLALADIYEKIALPS